MAGLARLRLHDRLADLAKSWRCRAGDLDMEEGHAITRGEDNKGKRDERVKLHPVVVDHLKQLRSFEPNVFPWNHDRRTLDDEFAESRPPPGSTWPAKKKHEHTEACHFVRLPRSAAGLRHGERRRLTADALQKLMRHKSYSTTQRYINMASQLEEAVEVLHVPDVLKIKKA